MRRDLSCLTVAVIAVIALIAVTGCSRDAAPVLPEGFAVLAEARGDLDGNGREDVVRLVGSGAADSPFREELALLIGSSPDLVFLPRAAAGGYGPTLQLVDVTGDGAREVVVVADTGGSGGMVAAAVMRARRHGDRWDLQAIFDSETGPLPELGGSLEPGFSARLEVTAPGEATRREVLELISRRDTYLQIGIYDAEGELQRPVEIWGGGLMGLAPLDPDTGATGLHLIQQARGASNADRLAEIHTDLVWQENHWQTRTLTIRALN